MKKGNLTNYFIITIGVLLLLNSLRLLILWMMGQSAFPKSDAAIVLLIWGPVFGIVFFMFGSKSLEEQGYLSKFLKRRSGTLLLIAIAVVLIVLFNLK